MAFENIYGTHNITGTTNNQIVISLKRAPRAPFVIVSLGIVTIAQSPGKSVFVNSVPITVGVNGGTYPIVSVLGSPNYSANEFYLYASWSSSNTQLTLYISANNAAPTQIYGSLSPQIWDMG
jgi:hypothetical protein